MDKSVYTLEEIANWAETNQVSLPTVQRGFVWKPTQIENLWDSLLRGYPVGAFVLANNEETGCEILDGQQRATAICLGFSKETFRDSQDNIKVFIDLIAPDISDSRKYVFRVLTRSHPWGYRRSENNKTLTSDNIRKSMDLYDTTDPLTTDLKEFFPFDADFPVPFHFFINAALKNHKVEQLHSTITEWEHYDKIFQKWKVKSVNEKKTEKITRAELKLKISSIFDATVEMLADETGQKIPALYLNLNKFLKDDENIKEEAADEIENLFVRLNAGGTQLSGEELNYSILKAHLQRETQNTIEEACKNLFRPSRFITVAYRLFQQTQKSDQQADALTMRIKPKQFQRSISKKVHDFEKFLIKISTQKTFNNKTLLDYTQEVLAYDNQKCKYGLPFVIYSKIADSAPEIMFLLLYRIYFRNDKFPTTSNLDKAHHQKALGLLTLFYWFGKGENQKDHSKLLSNVWVAASTLNAQRFWSSETVQRAYINNALIPFPFYYSIDDRKGIDKVVPMRINEKSNIKNKFKSEIGERYGIFFNKISFNKDLVMYAQRNFLENYFKQQQYRLEDTSVPFDWDHIAPNNWIKSKHNIPKGLKDWYQSNGNFRAWPYALNRMDSDNSPGHKLKPLKKTDSTSENLLAAKRAKWDKFINENKNLIVSRNEVESKLLEWSFCESKWANCIITDIKREWKQVAELIVRRNYLLIKEWYDQLLIEGLKDQATFSLEDILVRNKWKAVPIGDSAIDDLFNQDYLVTRISNNIKIENTNLRFYFSYEASSYGYLKDDAIRFGIYQKDITDFIRRLEKNKIEIMDRNNYNWLEKRFTLVSSNQEAVFDLLNQIIVWIKQLQYSKKETHELCNSLKSLILKKYNSKL